MAQEQLKSRGGAEQPKRNPQPNGATKHEVNVGVQGGEIALRRPTPFAKFIRDIGILLVWWGGGGYTDRQHIITKGKLAEISQKATDKLQKDDLESLKEAESLYLQMLDLDSSNDRALS